MAPKSEIPVDAPSVRIAEFVSREAVVRLSEAERHLKPAQVQNALASAAVDMG